MYGKNLSSIQRLKTVRAIVLSLVMALAISCTSIESASTNINKPENQISPRSSPTPQVLQTQSVEDPAPEIEPTYTGEYVNPTFGYKVMIPDGLKGKGSPEPQQQHGFVIELSPENKALLSVDGSYNALLWRSLDEAYNEEYKYRSKDATILEVKQKKKIGLDTHPAIWSIIRYADKKTGETRIESQILSMRNCSDEELANIIYKIYLDTPESRFTQDRVAMEQLLRSWKLLEKCE
jgi:hypothetical protein